jgi:hypothetical protein
MRCQGKTATIAAPIMFEPSVNEAERRIVRILLCPECRVELRGIIQRTEAGDTDAKSALQRERPEFQEPIFHAMLKDWK